MAFEKWRLLCNSYPSPSQNLALEEALLECCELDKFTPTCRIWFNSPSVVMGRFQNVSLEVNTQLCLKKRVQILRRFTGGGTLYHDEGNLNLTILRKRDQADLETVQAQNMSVIKRTLSKFGIESVLDPPNSLLTNGKKISGSASALNRNFILWHASVLVSTDLDTLQQVLSPSQNYNRTIHVRSRWCPTTSIQQLLRRLIQLSEVRRIFVESIHDLFDAEPTIGSLSAYEETAGRILHEGKYSKNSWNLDGQNISQFRTHTTIAV
ncbi:MAG TPA: lipoate--protein ligase family protein [Candidatus Bathyarchaeia archaeon]|nr:lipoate--protein ligase family protein [Candidatus Bathyarchaeia archaeon]